MCCHRFSWQSILEVKVFLFAVPQPFAPLFLNAYIQWILSFFWTPHFPVVLIHIKLGLLCSSQKLLLNPVPSAIHAWLITVVKIPTQPKPFFLALSQSGPITCNRKFRSGALSRQPRSQHGLTVQNGGAALAVYCL